MMSMVVASPMRSSDSRCSQFLSAQLCLRCQGEVYVLRRVVAGTFVALALLLVVHVASPRSIGIGDVKYAASLGTCLGCLDWRLAVRMLLVASITGAVVPLFLGLWRQSLPFGLLLGLSAFALVVGSAVTT